MMRKLQKKFNSILLIGTMMLGSISVCTVSAEYDVDTTNGKGGLMATIDYSTMQTSDVAGYETGLSPTTETKTTFDINAGEGALEIKTVGGADKATHYPTLPLGTEGTITTANGPFSIKIKAKLYNGNAANMANIRNFPTLSDGTVDLNFGLGWCTGQYISANNLGLLLSANNHSAGMWTYKAEQKIDNSEDAMLGRTDNNVNITKPSDRYFLGLNEASENYYTYRWDIDPESKTFRFYYQKDGESAWTEPYANFNMINPYTPELGDRFEEKGVFPTGDLPETISELKYQQRAAVNTTTALYIKSISVEQGVERPVVTSVTYNGEELVNYADNITKSGQIDIAFDREVHPDSITKDNILLAQAYGDAAAAYTLKLSDDKKTVSLNFSSLEHSMMYKLVISGVKANTQTQGEMGETKEYAFTIEPDPDAPDGIGGFAGKINYSNMTSSDLSGYETGLKSGTETKTTFGINEDEGALEITTEGGTNDNPTHYPKIPLGDISVDTTAGEFSLSLTAKLYSNADANIRNFPTLSDGEKPYYFGLGWCTAQYISDKNTGLLLSANNHSAGMWTYKAEQKIDNSEDAKLGRIDNNVNITKLSDRYFLGINEASEDYYTYKWDIDPASRTFKFYYRREGDKEWTEPYADFNMINPYTAELGDRFEEKGVFPTGSLPEKLTHLQYEQRVVKNVSNQILIKSIEVEQISTPKVENITSAGSTLTDNADDIEPDGQIDITFDRMVRPDSVSKDGIYFVDEKSGDKISANAYSLVQSNDYKTVSIVFRDGEKLDYKGKYTLIISGAQAFTKYRGEMKKPKKISFTTLARYEADKLTVDTASSDKVKFSFNLKDYVKENNGQKYAVIASLVEKGTNTTYDVGAATGISTYLGSVLQRTAYSFEFTKPQGFSAENFEIRLYVWDGFENSASILTESISVSDAEPVALEKPSICTWLDGKNAAVSLTIDDGIYDDAVVYNEFLKRYDVHATQMMWIKNNTDSLFTNGSVDEGKIIKWNRIFNDGYMDLGNHSYSHAIQYNNTGSYTESDLSADITTAATDLAAWFPEQDVITFATPWGQNHENAIAEIKKKHYANRGVGGGIAANTPTDFYKLPSFAVQYGTTASDMNSKLDAAISSGGWFIELFHGFGVDGTEGTAFKTKKTEFESHLGYINTKSQAGSVWAGSFNEVTKYIYERKSASVSLLWATENSVGIRVEDEMDDSVFDFPLTVMVNLPDTWDGVVNVVQNGKTDTAQIFKQGKENYAYVNIIPDGGDAIITLKS